MRGNRLFVAAAAIALVAGPGLAMAQSGPPTETPPVETPPVDEASPLETPPFETPPVETPEAAEQAEERPEAAEVEEVEDEAENEVVSALAECLPSGAELHGTGFNKGFIMRQAAKGDGVVLGEGDEAMPVATLADAEALCAFVQNLADETEAPETAKGRPDWAGPKGADEGDVAPAGRRGPPAHANAGGNGRGGSSDDDS